MLLTITVSFDWRRHFAPAASDPEVQSESNFYVEGQFATTVYGFLWLSNVVWDKGYEIKIIED